MKSNGPLIIGKNSPAMGECPAVCLINPKYTANVGAIQRAASCYNVRQVWFTGNRIKLEEGERLPRRENRPTISIDQSADGCLSVRVDGMFMFNMGSFIERMQFKGDPEPPKMPMERFCPLCGESIPMWSSAGHKCKYND